MQRDRYYQELTRLAEVLFPLAAALGPAVDAFRCRARSDPGQAIPFAEKDFVHGPPCATNRSPAPSLLVRRTDGDELSFYCFDVLTRPDGRPA